MNDGADRTNASGVHKLAVCASISVLLVKWTDPVLPIWNCVGAVRSRIAETTSELNDGRLYAKMSPAKYSSNQVTSFVYNLIDHPKARVRKKRNNLFSSSSPQCYEAEQP